MTVKLLASIYTHGTDFDKFGIALDMDDNHLSSMNYESEKHAAIVIVNAIIQRYGIVHNAAKEG